MTDATNTPQAPHKESVRTGFVALPVLPDGMHTREQLAQSQGHWSLMRWMQTAHKNKQRQAHALKEVLHTQPVIQQIDLPNWPVLLKPVPMSAILAAQAKRLGCRFTANGVEIPPEDVFQESAFLPIVAMRASESGKRTLKNNLGFPATYYQDASSILGVRVEVPDFDASISTLTTALYFQFATRKLFGMNPDTMVEVAHLIPEYRQQIHQFLQIPDEELLQALQQAQSQQEQAGEVAEQPATESYAAPNAN